MGMQNPTSDQRQLRSQHGRCRSLGPGLRSSNAPPPKDGTLVFETNIDGVELFVDGISRGVLTKSAPLRLPGLKTGNHTIQGVKTGYEPDGPRDEMVYPGQESTVSIKILIARRRTKAALDELNDGLNDYNKGSRRQL